MRRCLPITILRQQLVDNASLSPAVRREIFIRETEKRIIEGTTPLGKSLGVFIDDGVNWADLETRALAMGVRVAPIRKMDPFMMGALSHLSSTPMGAGAGSIRCLGPNCRFCRPSARQYELRGLPSACPNDNTRRLAHNFDALFPR